MVFQATAVHDKRLLPGARTPLLPFSLPDIHDSDQRDINSRIERDVWDCLSIVPVEWSMLPL